MRYRIIQRVVSGALLGGLVAYLGCATPRPCTVTPVDVEEIKSDIRDLDKQLATEKERLSKLQAEVAELEAEIGAKRLQIPVVQAEFDRLKKASGKSERSVEQNAAADSTAGSAQ